MTALQGVPVPAAVAKPGPTKPYRFISIARSVGERSNPRTA